MWLYLNSQIMLGGQLLLYCDLDVLDVYVFGSKGKSRKLTL